MGDMQPTRISLDEFTKLSHQRYKSRCKSKAQNPVMTMIMELNISDAIIIDHGISGGYCNIHSTLVLLRTIQALLSQTYT